jgi:methylmalonyl-CoA mutase N-terminal domain/subunit
VLAFETGIAREPDPLGGSIFLETLTARLEAEAGEYIRRIDEMGGMIPAIERGFPQREIADASYRYQVATDRKEKIIVGVNDFIGEEKPIEILRIDESVRAQQSKYLRKLRAERSSDEVARQLTALREAAQGTENLMPHIYSAVKSYATLGEICDALRDVFGTHEEVSVT